MQSKCSEAVSEMDTVESGPRGEGKRGREGETGKGREETGVAASRNKKNKRQKVSSYGTTSTAASDLDKATMNLLQGRHSKGSKPCFLNQLPSCLLLCVYNVV